MSIDDELDKVIVPKIRPGYVCNCPKGSPKPHWVVRDAKLHEEGCHIRAKLVKRRL